MRIVKFAILMVLLTGSSMQLFAQLKTMRATEDAAFEAEA